MKTFSKILFCLCFLSYLTLKAQEPPFPLIKSGEVIEEGLKFYEDKNYDEAIKKYSSVSRNDTAYAYALSELALTYLAAGDSIKAIEVSKKGIELNGDYLLQFYQLLGSAYDEADSLEKSIETYKKALEKFPYVGKSWFEMGVAYARHDNDSGAARCFQKSIQINPLHAGSHLQLGNLAARNNKYTQAILSYEMFLLLENSTQRSINTLANIEKIAGGEIKSDPDSITDISKGMDHFDEIEEIIKSKAQLSDKYTTDVKIKYLKIVKTLQAVNEKLEYNASDKGFWMQTYVPFLTALWKNNYFEGMIYHFFAGLDKETEKIYKSNKSKVDKMADFASDFILNKITKDKMVVNGKTYDTYVRYFDNDNVKSIGNFNKASSQNTGPWVFFYSNGYVRSEGSYDEKGMRQGDWKYYYETSELSSIRKFKDDKLDGEYKDFYKNGQLKEKGAYKSGIEEGKVEFYYSSGVLNAAFEYKNGKKDGPEKVYHPNGRMSRDANNKADIYDGSYKTFFDNGKVRFETILTNGKQNGIEKNYYSNGQIKSEGNTNNDLAIGEWKYYFSSGQIQKTGTFNNGKETGVWKEFYENGKPETENTYTNGAKSGVAKLFDDDGIQYAEIQYGPNGIKKYKYMDKAGKIVSQGDESGGKLDFVSYYPDGTQKNTEGKMVKGKNQGLWVQYHYTGKKANEINYVDDVRDGECRWYYQNGKLSEKTNYKEGETDGFSTTYYKNGNVKAEGWFYEDEKAGDWNEYSMNKVIAAKKYYMEGKSLGYWQWFDSKGRLQYENCYDENEMPLSLGGYDTTGKVLFRKILDKGTGEYLSLHLNGKQNQKVMIKGGEKDGDAVYLYPNGAKHTTEHYGFGSQQGLEQNYYYNGKVNYEYYYKDGDRDSTEKTWHENGVLYRERKFKEGELEGPAVWYEEDGKKSLEGTYHHDLREGPFIYYATDGKTVRVRLTYKAGDIISYSYLDKTGNYVPEIPVKLRADKLVSYYQNGNKSMELNLADGYYEGKRIYYYPSGKVETDYNYASDDLNGMCKEYYENGQVKSEVNYVEDEIDGTAKYYTDKGALKKEIKYICDMREGLMTELDEATGKTKKKITFVNDMPYEK